jgi:hypothetical protein
MAIFTRFAAMDLSAARTPIHRGEIRSTALLDCWQVAFERFLHRYHVEITIVVDQESPLRTVVFR